MLCTYIFLSEEEKKHLFHLLVIQSKHSINNQSSLYFRVIGVAVGRQNRASQISSRRVSLLESYKESFMKYMSFQVVTTLTDVVFPENGATAPGKSKKKVCKSIEVNSKDSVESFRTSEFDVSTMSKTVNYETTITVL